MNEVWRAGYLRSTDTLSLKVGRVLISDVKARLMVRHHSEDTGSWQHRSHTLVEQVGGETCGTASNYIWSGKSHNAPDQLQA